MFNYRVIGFIGYGAVIFFGRWLPNLHILKVKKRKVSLLVLKIEISQPPTPIDLHLYDPPLHPASVLHTIHKSGSSYIVVCSLEIG